MRDLIYYVATTLDGYIAHEDGSFDGITWGGDFEAAVFESFPETIPIHMRGEANRADNRVFDAVLMGRKTYEIGLREGITNPYPTLDQYVFSTTMKTSPDEQVHLVKENVSGLVTSLKEESGKAIWLCGGGTLAGTLLAAGLIDKLIVKLNPVLFGTGIPLFAGNIELTALELTYSQAFDTGHVILHYRVG